MSYKQTEGMTSSEHVAQAAEYIERAEANVWRHATRSSDKLPFVGEDASLERHVNVYTRLATLHMQMASTKALLGSTPRPMSMAELEQLMNTFPSCSNFQEVEPRHCDQAIKRHGDLERCGNLLKANGECPAWNWHARVAVEDDPEWGAYWSYWMYSNDADVHPADEDTIERQEDFINWKANGRPKS
jgi:hypothetical protein